MFDRFSEYRGLSVTCLMQVLLFVIGWSITCIHLKMMGYPDHDLGYVFFPESLWVRHWGMSLLLVPLGWAILGFQVERSLADNTGKWTIFGIGLLLTVAIAFFLGLNAFQVGYRPIYLVR